MRQLARSLPVTQPCSHMHMSCHHGRCLCLHTQLQTTATAAGSYLDHGHSILQGQQYGFLASRSVLCLLHVHTKAIMAIMHQLS